MISKSRLLAVFLLFATIVFINYSQARAWCVAGRGNTCKEKESQRNNRDGILNVLNVGGSGDSGDGADSRRNEDGDKSKNQGYSNYKRFAIGLMVSAYAVPYQDGNQYTGVEGMSAFLEHNISEFFTIGATHIQQRFSHLEDEFSDDDISHKHTAAYAGLRVWITRRSVVRANIGMANSEVSYKDKDLSGTTEFMSVGYEYALDDSDSSRIGYRYISIAGKDDAEKKNIGMSLHGLTFQVLF
jgi:hypothetical protein